MTDIEFIAHYLGKAEESQSVRGHLEEVADLAGIFTGKIGLPSLGKLEGLLHDFGKYSDQFQAYIRSAEGKFDPDSELANTNSLKGKIDHSTAGAQFVWGALSNRGYIGMLTAQIIALCVASHHGAGLNDCITPDGENKFITRMNKGKEKTHFNEVIELADRSLQGKIAELLNSSQLTDELQGKLGKLFADENSRVIREFYLGLLVRFIFSALIDADRLSAAGRNNALPPDWNVLIERLERHLSSLAPNNWVDEIRGAVSRACRESAFWEKGTYQLSVPTGGGKTLSSLRFGLHHAAHHNMDHLIYVIPYTSIIDQNAAVARSILEAPGENPILLEHHSNLTPEKDTWQNRLFAENWDAPVIFTTMVQFLETLFSGGTRGARRMHQLANAVIVFDEIQNLPIKTVHLFNNAINFLVTQCGATVLLCTATQPLLDQVNLEKGAVKLAEKPEMAPNIEKLSRDLCRVEVFDKIKNGGWSDTEIAQLICEEARKSGSALTVVNTKAAALSIYDLCKEQMGDVYYLTTNMCPAHRMKIINEMKARLEPNNIGSKPFVCVSTQLIEAGVDIDFGSVIRYLAGLDSIAQAAGRCNRNGSRPSGNVFIINPANESLNRLPEIEMGKRTAERVIGEFHKDPNAFDNYILSHKAMERYYEYYFFNRARDMAYPVSVKDIGRDDDLLTLLSTNALSVESYLRHNKTAPPIILRQSFKSAGNVFKVIEAPTQGFIVQYDEKSKKIINKLWAGSEPRETIQLLREAQLYSVNLYPHEFQKLSQNLYEIQKGSDIWYLDERYYSNELGVIFEPRALMEFKCV